MEKIKNQKTKWWKSRGSMIYFAIIGICIIFSFLVPNFFSLVNLTSILTTMCFICILSLGVTFVLTTGEIDISIGAMMSVAPCTIAVMYQAGVHIVIAFICALLLTLLMGLGNGLVVSVCRVPSFIATLGMQGIAMGYTRIITGNKPIAMENEDILNVFGGTLGGIPKMILWMLVLLAAAYFILHKMQFGRNLHCVGDNRGAAEIYGLNVKRYVTMSFVLASGFVFFAGVIDMARSSFATVGAGESIVLNAIVASVIGGTSLAGGKGTAIGAFAGSFFLAIISNALFNMGFMPWVTNIIVGTVIIGILTVSGFMEKRSKEKAGLIA